MIPVAYAAVSAERQAAIAQRIVDLSLLRDDRLRDAGSSGFAEHDAVIDELMDELDRLEAPFRRVLPGRVRRAIDPRPLLQAAHFDEATFLRRFEGEPAFAGDLLLAQVEARQAEPLLAPLLGMTTGQLWDATEWWGVLTTTESGEFTAVTRRIARFYGAAAEAAAAELDAAETESSGGGDASAELRRFVEVLGVRQEQFATAEPPRRIFEDGPDDLQVRVGPVGVSESVLRRALGAVGEVLGALRRRRHSGEDEVELG